MLRQISHTHVHESDESTDPSLSILYLTLGLAYIRHPVIWSSLLSSWNPAPHPKALPQSHSLYAGLTWWLLTSGPSMPSLHSPGIGRDNQLIAAQTLCPIRMPFRLFLSWSHLYCSSLLSKIHQLDRNENCPGEPKGTEFKGTVMNFIEGFKKLKEDANTQLI